MTPSHQREHTPHCFSPQEPGTAYVRSRRFDAEAVAVSVGILRRRICQALDEFGCSHLYDPVAQVTSELLTNAIVHGALGEERLSATLTRFGCRLALSVRDNNPQPPTPARASADAENGRGIMLVEVLAAAWEYRSDANGKTVTAEFDVGC